MAPTDIAGAYKSTASKTVTTGPMLLVALYDRLANDIALAKQCIEDDNLELANDSILHAQKIVVVLRSSLQQDGFEGAHDLWRLYNTVHDLLVKANFGKDVALLGRCEEIVGPLRAAWTEAVSIELGKEAVGAGVGMG